MMETEEKYKVVIVDDERTAIDALRRELEPYREFEVKGIAGNGAKGKKMIMEETNAGDPSIDDTNETENPSTGGTAFPAALVAVAAGAGVILILSRKKLSKK